MFQTVRTSTRDWIFWSARILRRQRGRALVAGVMLAAACVNDAPPDADCNPQGENGRCDAATTPFHAEPDPSCTAAFEYVTPETDAVPGRVVEMGADDSQLYFITHEHLYSVSRAGGTPRRLFSRTPEVASTLAALWVRSDDLVVYQDEQHVFLVPKDGGRAQQINVFDRLLGSTLIARARNLVAGWRFGATQDGRPYRKYWLLDVDTLEFSELGRAPAILGDDSGALADGALFWTDQPSSGETSLYSIPTSGGEMQPIELTPERDRRFMLFGAAAGQLYMFGAEDGGKFELLRTSLEGGAVETLGDAAGHAEGASVPQFARTDAGVLLGLRGSTPRDPEHQFWLPRGAAQAELVPCIEPPSGGSAFAIAGDVFYQAVATDSGGIAIVKRSLGAAAP